MTEIQENNVGTLFKVRVIDEDGAVVDVSTATTKEIILRSPDGEATSHPASFTTDGTDGYIQYVGASGVLDTLGIWEMQSHIIIGSNEWYGTVSKFRVLRNATP